MSLSNLPPGCRESDIPGNSAADAAWEQFMDWAWDHLTTLELAEARRAVLMGIAAVNAERIELLSTVRAAVDQRLADMAEEAAHTHEDLTLGDVR